MRKLVLVLVTSTAFLSLAACSDSKKEPAATAPATTETKPATPPATTDPAKPADPAQPAAPAQ